MATTDYGVNHPLAVKAWAKMLQAEALKETYIFRFIGEDGLVYEKDEVNKGPGDRITCGLRMQLSGAGVQGDNTLEGQEEALTTYSDNILVNQIRHAVRTGGKMSEQRVPFSIREEARLGLKDWFADRIDTSAFNQLCGNTAQADTRYTGNNATVAPTATRRIFADAVSVEGSLSATTTHALTLSLINKAVAMAKTSTPLIRPFKVGGKDKYVMFIHPFDHFRLRENTATGQYLDIQKAAIQGGQIADNPLYTGAIAEYNNVVLHESTRVQNIVTTPASGTVSDFRRPVLCGAQSLLLATGMNSEGLSTSWTEELFDYGNQLGVSSGLIFGMKKAVYNSTDFGVITFGTYAPNPN